MLDALRKLTKTEKRLILIPGLATTATNVVILFATRDASAVWQIAALASASIMSAVAVNCGGRLASNDWREAFGRTLALITGEAVGPAEEQQRKAWLDKLVESVEQREKLFTSPVIAAIVTGVFLIVVTVIAKVL